MLEPGQVEELKQLMALLPRLVLKSQFVEEKKERIAAMETRAAVELTSKDDGGSFPSFRRTDSDEFSDITLPVNNERVGRHESVKDVDCESFFTLSHFQGPGKSIQIKLGRNSGLRGFNCSEVSRTMRMFTKNGCFNTMASTAIPTEVTAS